jgi:transcriptional regulator with XRE-family HTH domain
MKLKVGNRLFSAREERKINQTEMAKILGLSQSAYSRLEVNETSAEIEQIVNFAKLLQIPVQEFLPETCAIHSNNGNGQIGFVIGNSYNYSDKESLHTIELKDQELTFLKRENQLLQDKIQHLEELLQVYKQQKATQNEENDNADLTDEQKEILKSRHEAMKANPERRMTWEEAKSKLLNS